MPIPGATKTIQDLIYYQYAKIIAKRAFKAADGKEAKKQSYGFIKKTFRELKSGAKSWSEITREDRQFVEVEKRCIYRGAENDLHWEHIVPKSLSVKPQCETCETIQGIHNQIWACSKCNFSKGTKGLYEFYDFIQPLLEKKYLKTIIKCHECANTLCSSDLDHDREITVLDIDFILHQI